MLIAVASLKGAPGATTLAVGLAALWPTGRVVLVEADPAGGDLAARFGCHAEPGLTTLAASGRPGGAPRPLRWHAQRLAVGADVVLAPPGEAAAASVHTLARTGRHLLADPAAGTVIADVGRIAPGAPGAALAGAADHLVVVVRPTLEQQAQLATRLDWLKDLTGGRMSLALAGKGAYSVADITQAWGVKVAGVLPENHWGAGVLGGRLAGGSWRRMRLPRAISETAARLSLLRPAAPTARPAAEPPATYAPSASYAPHSASLPPPTYGPPVSDTPPATHMPATSYGPPSNDNPPTDHAVPAAVTPPTRSGNAAAFFPDAPAAPAVTAVNHTGQHGQPAPVTVNGNGFHSRELGATPQPDAASGPPRMAPPAPAPREADINTNVGIEPRHARIGQDGWGR